ncbi:MAG: DUF389 domain-containing protein [Gemmatimonadaceae bacterium]
MPNTEDPLYTRLLARTHHWRLLFAHLVALPDLSDEESAALRKSVREEGALNSGYILMSALSAGIATLGLLQSSVAVVIGAMLVSPLMSPIAALGFGFASLDGHRIRDAVRVVIIGAVIGVVTGMVITWISPIRNPTSEIIGRTQPTLLDLAIALLSGVAGGYATVRQKGGTAIGVAIATALMPPLATVGYSIGVANWEFAGGALLLFLTNLAAIAFSFAVIARLSGVARPLSRVEITPGYVAAGIAVFAALATPLGLTLLRVAKEARVRSAVRSVLTAELHVSTGKITQLEVKWPLRGNLLVDAVVIDPAFLPNAQQMVESRLIDDFGVHPIVNVQQIVASDNGDQTRALIDAAMERNASGIAKDAPPFDQIRSKVGLPVQSIWVDRSTRIVHVVPADAPNWSLEDYWITELSASAGTGDWHVRITPPTGRALSVPFPRATATADSVTQRAMSLAIWALQRWGVAEVVLETTEHKPDSVASAIDRRRMETIVSWLSSAKVRASSTATTARGVPENEVRINVFSRSPSEVRARVTTRLPPQ